MGVTVACMTKSQIGQRAGTDQASPPLAGWGALVTGGSGGIGGAVARRLAADGAAVVLTYRSHRAEAEDVVAEIRVGGGSAAAVELDVTVPEQVAAAFDAADEVFASLGVAGLAIVVAAAGVAAHQPLSEVGVGDWDRVLAINARGALLTLQQAARRMLDGGRIITVSTIGTAWPSPGETTYAASKAAVEQISRVASRELGARQITVNTVSPGPTDTALLRAGAPADAIAGAAAMTALGRIAAPDDIADLIGLLVRPDNRWVTGQILRADGGLT